MSRYEDDILKISNKEKVQKVEHVGVYEAHIYFEMPLFSPYAGGVLVLTVKYNGGSYPSKPEVVLVPNLAGDIMKSYDRTAYDLDHVFEYVKSVLSVSSSLDARLYTQKVRMIMEGCDLLYTVNDEGLALDFCDVSDCVYQEMSELYYEIQQQKDSCFIHAINMYFETNYINGSFKEAYNQLIQNKAESINSVKGEESVLSFYGLHSVPDNKDLEDGCSDVEKDDDLKSYYELYTMLTDTLESVKTLGPLSCLMLLEFPINENKLFYHPHRFYHRYCRSTDESDQAKSKSRFIAILEEVEDNEHVFFARIERDKSHAFGAIRLNNQWVLLDSIMGKPVFVGDSNTLIDVHQYAGRASIMIIRDKSRRARLI